MINNNLTHTQMKIIKVILRNMQFVNPNNNNFYKMLVKITCLDWVEKEMVCGDLAIETSKDIKWFYYKELLKMKW